MEQIIEKLKKIKSLADRGVAGEAIAAQQQLEKLLAKHNLTIDDLFNEERKDRMFKVKTADEMIFIQVALSIIGNRAKTIWHYKGDRTNKYLELTDVEFIDISSMFDFHKKQLEKEKKKAIQTLETAYVYKHDLFNCDKSDTPSESKMTIEEYCEIMAMKNRLEDVTFRKQLSH